jgi:hypothetical protein
MGATLRFDPRSKTMQRMTRNAAIGMLVCLLFAAQPAAAQYRYGKYRYSSSDQGFFVILEAALANPRNADAVVATYEQIDIIGGQNLTYPIVPVWDDDLAGRVGVGYSWASGNKLVATFWGFRSEQSSSGEGPSAGRLHFAVGPPIPTMEPEVYEGTYGAPGTFDITTEIRAATADVAWVRELELSDNLDVEWSLGLRYASFEETMEGLYNTGITLGSVDYSAAKSNEGEMIGLRSSIRGRFFLTGRLSVGGAIALSMLDGELTASSVLTEGESIEGAPSNSARISDDGRSGTIVDFDAGLTWHSSSDRLRVTFGWEQSVWNDIASDLVRNFPGTTAPLADRDSVTFSGYKLGMFFRF